jgi:hypothetical protein
MNDARLFSPATLAAKDAHATAMAAGESPGRAFDLACAAYAAAAAGAPMLELQAIVAEAIGLWRRGA